MNYGHGDRHGFFKSRWNFVLIAFLLIAGFFLLAEHRAHLFAWLPYALLLACPLLHVFGHGRHGKGRGTNGGNSHGDSH